LYRKKDNQATIDDYLVPFGGYLLADNRWVIKAKMIPWDEIEGEYADLFPSGTGTVAMMKKPRKKQLRKAIRQQLNFVRRNLKHNKVLSPYYKVSPLTIT
jgi:transposase, IS5 family